MNFPQSIRTCLSKYVTFSGRAARSEYWWFVLFGLLANLAAGVLDAAFFDTDFVETVNTATEKSASVNSDGPIASLISLALFLPGLAVGWRRMHDMGRSGLFLIYPVLVMLGIGTFLAFSAGLVGASQAAFGLSAVTSALGGLTFMVLIPALIVLLLAPLLVLWWLTRPSQPGANQYGPNPHEGAE